MDHLHERLEALEQQMHTVTRRLRWWRGLACSLVVLGLLSWGLPLSLATEEDHRKDKDHKGLAHRVAALEKLLKHFSREGKDIFITGANLHIVNGLGSTDCFNNEGLPIPDCPNGLGNLIVGYNESRIGAPGCESSPADPFCIETRIGSHNVVVGELHNFSRFGGLVVGRLNEISGDFASVSGGQQNTASGHASSVSGGQFNTASVIFASVSGGLFNIASGGNSSVSGGSNNTASGGESSVSGGRSSLADGEGSSVSGGEHHTASGIGSWVSGGRENTANGDRSSISGGFRNTASGLDSSVSGGLGNTASGIAATVSGGSNITQETQIGWSAGSEADEVVVGNVRSP